MDEHDWLADRFEVHRRHLRSVAYRMLGSIADADDAVQEAWFRLSSRPSHDVENLAGWLTTVVARVCLDMLRLRSARREEPGGDELTRVVADESDEVLPEDEALLADSVGVALLMVLDTLTPAERLAFVLHDMFDVPFDEIAAIVDRSPAATRQLASRARRKARGASTSDDPDRTRQRELVDAFLAASREGDFEGLLAVLDPEIALRADAAATPSGTPITARGASAVARRALAFSRRRAHFSHLALVNGRVGLVVAPGGQVSLVLEFTIAHDKITGIDVVADPGRLRRLDVAALDE